MTLVKAAIRGFRCFDRYDIELDPHYTVIAGPNASGKTSLLEAFHIASRLRSFRTPTITDLIKHGSTAFSVRLSTLEDEVHVAYGPDAHVVEINGSGPTTRGKLLQAVSLITITEQDLDVIQGYPEGRRTFLDQASIARGGSEVERVLKKYYQILRQRNALLHDPMRWNRGSYEIITEQAWSATLSIRDVRRDTMGIVEQEINVLLQQVIPGIACQFSYEIPELEHGIIGPEQWCNEKESHERRMKRSLMGAHLDDMGIFLQGQLARRFASRGMQKALAVIMKVAQAKMLPGRATLLLDDLLADFDEERLKKIMEMLVGTGLQLVFTAPIASNVSFLDKYPFPITARLIHLGC